MKKITFILLIIILLMPFPTKALQYFYDKPIYSHPGGQKIGEFKSGTLINNYQIVDNQGNWICIEFRDGHYFVRGWINKSDDNNEQIDYSDMFKVSSIQYENEKLGNTDYIKVTGEIKNESKKDFSSGVVLKIILYDFFDNIIATKDIVVYNWTSGSTKVFDELFNPANDNDADDVRDYKIQYEVGS